MFPRDIKFARVLGRGVPGGGSAKGPRGYAYRWVGGSRPRYARGAWRVWAGRGKNAMILLTLLLHFEME